MNYNVNAAESEIFENYGATASLVIMSANYKDSIIRQVEREIRPL